MGTIVKILVVEDMIETIRGAFELAALSDYNEYMTFVFKRTSQEVDYEHINDYALVFVDIELSKGSREDGFAVIRKLLNSGMFPLERTLILTGNTVIEDKLMENNINPQIEVVKKPVNYDDIVKVLKKKIKLADDGSYSLVV